MDRTVRAFERDKNHPSIMSWSLGNESGTGANLVACARWVHERTGSRAIVHYEGDHALEYTDIYSRMYPTLEEVAAVLDESDPHAEVAVPTHVAARVDDAARERIRRAPYIMCEYLHAMEQAPETPPPTPRRWTTPRHAGGFVWEWRDHALWRTLPDGRRALSYGGDFGEEVHDGSFVCDGLIDALSRPSPAPGRGFRRWPQTLRPSRRLSSPRADMARMRPDCARSSASPSRSSARTMMWQPPMRSMRAGASRGSAPCP